MRGRVPLSGEPLIVVHQGTRVNVNAVPAVRLGQVELSTLRQITTVGEYGVVVLSNSEMSEARSRGLRLTTPIFRILDENQL